MNTFKIRAATNTHFTDIDIEAGTIEQAITQFSAIVDEDPSRIFCDQEFDDKYTYHPTHIDNISDGDTGKELMDYSDKKMPKRWRHPLMVAKKERNELIDALQLMVDDLENNGEILRTDSARIEMMTNTLAKAGGNK